MNATSRTAAGVVAAAFCVLAGLYRDAGRFPPWDLLLGLPIAALTLWAVLRRVRPATTALPFLLPGLAVALLLPHRPDLAVAAPTGTVKHALAAAFSAGLLLWLWEAAGEGGKRGGTVFFAFVLLVASVQSVQPPGEHDEADYLLLAEALRRGDGLLLDDVYRSPFIERTTGYLPSLVAEETKAFRDGTHPPGRYSYRAPLSGAVFVPGLFLFDAVSAVGGRGPAAWFVLYILPACFVAAAFAACGAAFGPVSRPAVVATAAAPPFFYFAAQTQPEGFAVGLTGLAAWAIARRRAGVTAVALAALPLFHYRFGVLSLLLLLPAWRAFGARRALLPALGVVVGGIVAAGFLLFVVAHEAGSLPAALARFRGGGLEFGAPIWEASNLPRGLYNLLLRPGRGLFFWMPVSALAIFAARDRTARPFLFAAAGYLLFMAGYRNVQDTFPYSRYMVPSLGLLLPAVFLGARAAEGTAAGRALVVLTAAVTAGWFLSVGAVPLLWRSALAWG